MAGETKFIKGKIQATKKTSQITKAMNMVSASKAYEANAAAVDAAKSMIQAAVRI